MTRAYALALAAAMTCGSAALAADAESCEAVRLSDPGWTDITATNAVASVLLTALGYEPEVKTLSVPIGYEAMKNADIDVFLGNWMPAQASFRDDLEAAGAAEVLTQNLAGAKFTLAVPDYVAEQGISDFEDLAARGEGFDMKIYGIETGAPANQSLQKMIDAGDFGLAEWSLVESGEQAMLAQVERAGRSEQPIVFLAWAPHPMNTAFDLTYLSGGDAYFGPDFGGAQVYTLARTGWAEECPNAAQFFRNLVFQVEMENEIMGLILDGADSVEAAETWLKENPDAIGPWLEGVTTLDGQPGLAAVEAALGS
ncbi:MAG: choline ABC transporter substrate-binding protein [Rhodobacteraceae bacterium]|nr:choline ABC transporter substrate-binding protein [Paracoccaceae bacterium]